MRIITKILVIILALFAFGCNEDKKQAEVRTVQWYTDHPEERTQQIKICADNPGQLKDEPNCINAKQSALRNSGGSVRRD